jgi:hypothetical protein
MLKLLFYKGTLNFLCMLIDYSRSQAPPEILDTSSNRKSGAQRVSDFKKRARLAHDDEAIRTEVEMVELASQR